MRRKILIGLAALALVFSGIGYARADTVVAGITFDDNAFADSLVSRTGTWSPVDYSALETVLTGSNPNDWAVCSSTDCSVVLAFTDNFLVNGAGADLAVFAVGILPPLEYFSVTINSITNTYFGTDTGYNTTPDGYDITVAQIDLGDFSISPGGRVSQLTLWPDAVSGDPAGAGNPDEFTVIGALNSVAVPLPSTLLLLGAGLTALAGVKRKLR